MKTSYMFVALIVVIMAGLIYLRAHVEKLPEGELSALDTFGQCLTDAGAKFYGAYWCPHCQAQKKLLGNSKKIPYVECSTPDQKGQTPICIEKKIESYPTWIFADGSIGSGEQTLEELAQKTNCALPVK